MQGEHSRRVALLEFGPEGGRMYEYMLLTETSDGHHVEYWIWEKSGRAEIPDDKWTAVINALRALPEEPVSYSDMSASDAGVYFVTYCIAEKSMKFCLYAPPLLPQQREVRPREVKLLSRELLVVDSILKLLPDPASNPEGRRRDNVGHFGTGSRASAGEGVQRE
jgi:hypothetical protein